jgi:CRP-like cAMP-binding protein
MEWALLRGLSDEDVQKVLAIARKRSFGRREHLWHEGDRVETMHLVISGRVGVRAATSMGDVVTLTTYGPGDVAGLIASMGTERHSSTSAIALEPTQTFAIYVEDLTAIRQQHRAIDEAVIRFMADSAIALANRLADALFVPAEIRVVRRLVALCEAYDRGEDQVTIPLTQEDIAELAGVTRPTVNRALKREEARGSVRLARGGIVVLDRERLATRLT